MKKLASLELNARSLRICALVLLGFGCIGSLIQRQVLGLGSVSAAELYQLMSELPHGMAYATISVVCQAMELCAVPIFAFLLAEGVRHTACWWKYLLRVLALAFVCEIPYNLLTAGTVLAIGTLNPVFGAALTLGMLWFFRRFPERRVLHVLIRLAAVLGAFLWNNFLGVAFGAACALIAAALWAAGSSKNRQLLIGGAVSMACSILNPLYLVTPFSFLFLHLYNGERPEDDRRLHYLAYPLLLTALAVFSLLGP